MDALMKQDKEYEALTKLQGTLSYFNNHPEIYFSEYVTHLVAVIGQSIFLPSPSSTNVSIL